MSAGGETVDRRQRRLAVVSQVFHPDTQATGKLLSDLCAALAATGFNCEVVAGFPAKGRCTAPQRVGRVEVWQGVVIRRGGLRLDSKRNLAWRALAYLSFSVWEAWRLLFRTPGDTHVLVVTNPPFSPLVVAACSLVRSWKYSVLLHDVYPDGLVATGMLARGALIERGWSGANRWVLGRAVRVVVLGRDMAQLVRERFCVPEHRLEIVPNWGTGDRQTAYNAAEETKLWKELGFSRGTFIVQYSGNMGLWHDLDTVVRAAAQLTHDRHVKFLMIGDGRRKSAAMRCAQELGCQNMLWLPFQPAAALADSLACCHVGLVSQRAGLQGVAVPSKVYGILAAGRAVLAQVPDESEVALVVREEQCGIVVAPHDPFALAAAIHTLVRDHAMTKSMGDRAYAAYAGKYTLAHAVKRLSKVIEHK